jgi:hypothetical protein
MGNERKSTDLDAFDTSLLGVHHNCIDIATKNYRDGQVVFTSTWLAQVDQSSANTYQRISVGGITSDIDTDQERYVGDSQGYP